MAFVASGACPQGPGELRDCVVQFICSQSTAFPLSVVGLNADLRRAYQRAGRPFSELRAFRAGSTGEAVRAVAAALQGMGRGQALQLEDTNGVEDLLVVEADRQVIRDALLAPQKAAPGGDGERRKKLPQPGPSAPSEGAPAPAPTIGSGGLPGGPPAGDGDDELSRLLAAPTVLARGAGEAEAAAEAGAERDRRRRGGEGRDRRRRRRDGGDEPAREDARPAEPAAAGAPPDAGAPPPQAPQQQQPPSDVWVFTPDGSGDVLPGPAAGGEAAAPQLGMPAPESPKRTLKTMPMFQWVSASSVEGLKLPTDPNRRTFRARSRSRRRSRSPQSPPKLAPGEVPLKLAGEAWEEPREKGGLRLVADGPVALASSGAAWAYPVADESRRSFAGYLRGALSAAACEEYFARIRDGTSWQQPEGPMGPMPRKTCWMVTGGCSCRYRYGGVEVPPMEFPDWMTELMGVVMPMCGFTRDQWPGACNLNLYEDGGMSVGWHADDERLFQGRHRDCQIVSLSLGARRTFELRLNFPEEGEHGFWKLPLGSGDLLTMEGMAQKHFQHRVPMEKNVRGPRINLTWRHVLKHCPSCPVKRKRH